MPVAVECKARKSNNTEVRTKKSTGILNYFDYIASVKAVLGSALQS